ncbi:gamma-glutamyltransferase [Bacillus subtilis]|uniref:gamma-glutamyltransferase n=1 Tax=Bacillus TaxID=1386 RepID=UPI0018CE3F97|nr:gamma-glutamyltransferase [Bacillus subtilis]MBG9459999.1 gamma-glutamyltranspeptidase [Bacillus subtilis]MBG9490673.1 gamma-glutamyltranspeptidase [Bacillus subtilis]MBG9572212.1 gamma-glutamyltranspeptidase [Bacillus subtilis]MBR9949960.1 gamma-glutamyltransferase [Bacillus subtilis]UML52448.1 gamma-glutamyltransferase [Bacillus subtilis]
MNKSVIGTKQMVVSPHYLASQAGNRILDKGGNAFDAAVAVSACLAVVYPHMTGLGGDSFWLTFHQETKAVKVYNGSGRSGKNVTRDVYKGKSAIPLRGIDSAITVPGMVDSWDAVLKEYGRLSLADVLEPARDYAQNGFPVSADQCRHTEKNIELLASTPYTADIFTRRGKAPVPGERFVQKELADSLNVIAEKGRSAFYEGDLAQRIVSHLQNNGSYMTIDDFKAHRGEWAAPVSSDYRGYSVYQAPPNSQGFTGLLTLNILENYDFTQIEHGSFEFYHVLVEALKKSFVDRNAFLTDPAFADIPLERLLDKNYAKRLAGEIGYLAEPAESRPVGSDTAYAAVIDADGNAVSFIQSLYFEFGSAVTAGDTGILLQNRGSFFSLDENHVNTLEPRKRTFHTLMPAMVCKGGKPKILYGTQGGEGQPQTQTAIITRMLDYGMHPQQAISEPRWVWGRTWGEEYEGLRVEGRFTDKTIQKLKDSGHLVEVVGDYDPLMGQAAAIKVDEEGFLQGGADPRGDGAAVGI